MGEAYLRNNQEQMRQRADVGRGVLNFLNPAPSLTSAVAEGRAPKGSDVALDAGLFAAGFIPFAGPGIRASGQAAKGAGREGLEFITRGSRNVAEPDVRYVEAVLPEAQRVNPEDAVGYMKLGPDGAVRQVFVEPDFRRQGVATEMWDYANRQGLNPVHSPVVDQTAAGQAWVASLGGRAARPALETAETINARRDAINRLLNRQGPEALEEYLQRPLTAYQATQNPDLLRRFFSETSERIPVGTQMYRAPSAGQVRPQQYSQSVPLPREAGAEWLPNRIQSTAGSEDLQRLGGLVKGLTPDTGGGQTYAPGMVAIEAMEDLPGIYNLNSYFDALDSRGLYRIPTRSNFTTESVLGPQTRYVVRDYVPDAGEGFPTWYLNAYAR
jgi:GNAT superfamily N-acetyltransferase